MAVAVIAKPYERAVAAIEAVSWRGIRPGLERTEALLEALGSPHRGLHGVLVAGTNGKGSVCALIDSVTRAAGLNTVLLTKPHLTSYRERIVSNGAPLDDEAFAAVVDAAVAAAGALPEELQPTGFELLTAAGILAAAQRDADVLVCEVGMGGRLDSTNVLDLGVAVVTNVALDHREHLGDTVTAIAAEKAAIIKAGDDAITTATQPALDVIASRCAAVGARLLALDPGAVRARTRGLEGVDVTARFSGHELTVHAPLVGAFQVGNVTAAVAACDALRARGMAIDATALLRGCAAATWPARMQWIAGEPPVLIDAAHNPAGMAAMVQTAAELAAARTVVAVFAAMRDKDVAGMAAALQRLPGVIPLVTAPRVQRACAPDDLAALFTPPARSVPGVAAALALAGELAGPRGLVLVCGSLYLAAEALAELSA